ncbi:hypothetical protein F5144DRAFT_575900 [Chaetomium tenue]|uniref:Uncharacterized protein n=1 Tax=Chaetomium tenue TaxID=1854479 RepID=A0ACB7P3J3_9PEZI|nr:hypothetical protein F5144DRAFT_575900 [Chaetomium globosum]
MESMSPPGRDAPVSDASYAPLPPPPPATSDLVLEAVLKARLEEIEQQRDDESAAMSDRLHALVKLYKRRDQSLVDRYTEYLEQASRLPPAASVRPWLKPCRGVVDHEIFYEAGVIVKFCPDPSRHLLRGDDTDEETEAPQLSEKTATKNPRSSPRAPSFSPLSSLGCSPEPTPKPTPKPASRPSEPQPRKRTKRPPSPDELALDSTPSSSVGSTSQRADGSLSRTSHIQPSRKPLPTYKPLSTHKRRKQTSHRVSATIMTTPITATTAQTSPPPASSSPLSSPSPPSTTGSTPPQAKPTPIPIPIPATLNSNADPDPTSASEVANSDSDSSSSSASATASNPNLTPTTKTNPPPPKPNTTKTKTKPQNTINQRRGGSSGSSLPPPLPAPSPSCLECRRRKVRCSRDRPRCELCSRFGRDCAYPGV